MDEAYSSYADTHRQNTRKRKEAEPLDVLEVSWRWSNELEHKPLCIKCVD